MCTRCNRLIERDHVNWCGRCGGNFHLGCLRRHQPCRAPHPGSCDTSACTKCDSLQDCNELASTRVSKQVYDMDVTNRQVDIHGEDDVSITAGSCEDVEEAGGSYRSETQQSSDSRAGMTSQLLREYCRTAGTACPLRIDIPCAGTACDASLRRGSCCATGTALPLRVRRRGPRSGAP